MTNQQTMSQEQLRPAAPLPRGRDLPDDDVIVIEPGRAGRGFWREVWSYRELFLALAWRDISVRYKQTAIGVLWAIIKPFLTLVIFTVIFGRLAGLPSEGGAPYALLVLTGLLPWTLFSTSVSDASNSLVANAQLIGKVYFPRIIIPSAAIVVGIVDFLVALAMLVGMMVWYEYAPSWRILFLPVFILLAALAALGPGMVLATMTVKYRDVRLIVPFVLQLGLYVSPVGYTSSLAPESWRLIYALNPLVGIIDGFRWCILAGPLPFDWAGIAISAMAVFGLLLFGFTTFRANEKAFADVI